MPNDPPFDVWNGVDLDTAEDIAAEAVEEVAMHLDPESEIGHEGEPAWSELTDEPDAVPDDDRPVRYFEDEQPEQAERILALNSSDGDERELDLEELLERQHYAFKSKSGSKTKP
jgi:hypothetical protein